MIASLATKHKFLVKNRFALEGLRLKIFLFLGAVLDPMPSFQRETCEESAVLSFIGPYNNYLLCHFDELNISPNNVNNVHTQHNAWNSGLA